MEKIRMVAKVALFRCYIGPLLLILLSPTIVMLMSYTMIQLNGSLVELWEITRQIGNLSLLRLIWEPFLFGSQTAWTILGVFAVTQLLFMKILPGKIFNGPITSQGNIPLYKANGIPSYFLTLLLFYLASYQMQLFSPTIIYDHFNELLGSLNLFSLLFCLFLLLHGYFTPSSSDSGTTGNVIFDYYWGTELYPRIFGWDIKMFTNCRFGLMSWSLIIWSFAAKQFQIYGVLSDSMLVAIILQFLYITKFYIWETGYLGSLDIMHDRAGFYICWGCLVWIPGIYTSSTLYLVNHPNQLGPFLTIALLFLGSGSILINYLSDRQRQKFRQLQGQCKIWGKPPQLIVASYITQKGEVKNSILLTSGWWGIARHFHYIPEITGALCWTLPAGFNHALPYFYTLFLTILLIDRAFRDDKRCAEKYGVYWDKYCQKVPYKIIPYVV